MVDTSGGVACNGPVYRDVSPIGKGGEGSAFSAYKIFNVFGREASKKVVLKAPNPEKIDPAHVRETLEGVVHEAGAIIGLNEQNVVHIEGVYDLPTSLFGYKGSGTIPVIEMEFLDGGSLDDFVDKHRFLGLAIPPSIIMYVMHSVASALDQAYFRRGVMHRDLCPNNVAFCSDGIIKVIDFGISAMMGSPDANYYDRGFSGKIDWAAPEQIQHPLEVYNMILKKTSKILIDEDRERRKHMIDIRSDTFTLGLLGYYMATLNNPYKFKRNKMKIEEILLTALKTRKDLADKIHPAWPSDGGVAVLAPLNNVIEKCMNISASERYGFPEEVMKACKRQPQTSYGFRMASSLELKARSVQFYMKFLNNFYSEVCSELANSEGATGLVDFVKNGAEKRSQAELVKSLARQILKNLEEKGEENEQAMLLDSTLYRFFSRDYNAKRTHPFIFFGDELYSDYI